MTNDYLVSVGSDPLNPLIYTYSAISMTGNIELVWPLNNTSATYTATNWVDVTSTAAYTITMPSAEEAPVGQSVQFNNYGSYTITINDADSNTITTVASGETKRIWIFDNSTAAGTWKIANIGSGTTGADASMLAGYGLQALAGQISESIATLTYSTNQTLGNGQRAYLLIWTGGAGTFTLPDPATVNSNWFFHVKNAGSGTLVLSPASGTIDGQATISVGLEEGFTVATNGTNYYSIGRVVPTSSGATLLSKSIAGGTDVTLTATEAAYNIINLTGAVSANINVVVPVTVREWIFYNATSGTYSVAVKTSSQTTGITVTQSTRNILYSDGTDVQQAVPASTGTVTSVATGTGLTGGTITTTGTLSLANTAVTAGTYGAAGTTVTFTVDAQGRLTNSTSQAITITDANLSSAISASKGGTGQTSLTANNVILGNGTSAVQFVAPGTSGNFLQSNGTTWASATTLGTANGGTGLTSPGSSGNVLVSNGTIWTSSTIQVGFAQTSSSAVLTSTTVMPFDDTVPTSSEGAQLLTLSYTPKNASNNLMIEVSGFCSISATSSGPCSGAIFVDATSAALFAGICGNSGTTLSPFTLRFYVTAGSTSSRTYKFRAGPDGAATVTFSGTGGSRRFGGVGALSMTVTEYPS